MNVRALSLSKRVAVPTTCLLALSMGALLVFVHHLYIRSFETTLARVEESSVSLKRESVLAMTNSIRTAGEKLLQTREEEQFKRLADEQRKIAGLDMLSYVDAEGMVKLASPSEKAGHRIDCAEFQRVAASKDQVVALEDQNQMMYFCPLRVTPDMQRLQPDKQLGQLYGYIVVQYSKKGINEMLVAARQQFDASVRRTLGWAIAGSAGGVVAITVILMLGVIRPIVRSLQRIIGDLARQSDELVSISLELNNSSQRLADSSSQQASSLEETSSAMEEMSANTHENAANAEKSNEDASLAKEAATEGCNTMTRLSTAMSAINSASDQTGKIMGVIGEIAFQTNLLALNAAVEAARAGEHGKGFAVVAEEVRNLAQRSAEAARQTAALIGDVVDRVKEGTSISGEVQSVLGDIVDKSSRVSDLVKSISTASNEQARGITQINTAMSQLQGLTQDNAAAAEETSAAAGDLDSHARAVRETIQHLIALAEGAGSEAAIDAH
jgi:methyl-accepting chemotaxis protein